MNHQQYEEWLFVYYDELAAEQLSTEQRAVAQLGEGEVEERLTSQQRADLQAHLKECADCRMLAEAWQAVDTHLRDAPTLEPQTGFTARWETRLQAERQQVQRRQTFAVLGFSAVGVALLLGSLVLLILPLIQSPKALVWAGVYRLITLLSYLQLAQDVILPFFQVAADAVPLFGWLLVAGVLTQLGVLWVVSYRVLTNPWRITR